MERLETKIPENTAGRLDKALAAAFPAFSRARLQALVEDSRVSVDGRAVTTPSFRLKGGEVIRVSVPDAAPAAPQAEAIALDVVYEDKDLIVINKPAGMVVHPAAGHSGGTLVNALLAHCGDSLSGIGGEARPGIVHRLDKDTSGLLVVAKNDMAHQKLSAQFSETSSAHTGVHAAGGNRANGGKKTLSRQYTAFIWGLPREKEGTIDAALGRSPAKSTAARKKMAVKHGGKRAITHFVVDAVFGTRAAQLTCQLETGRTHQIRVHLAHIGCSIIGDAVYGKARGQKQQLQKRTAKDSASLSLVLDFPRQALHASALSFLHPRSGKAMRFTAPLPADLQQLQKALKKLGKPV